ncbi:7789_t:CDS:10 [Acaulospora morrowiae]|uniref:Mannosyl-oligosaccharide glucosidase n=1 Tax=Acaulospora morrowiae TaxID=94023 RepID=A0A9N8Z3C7_9GLOM|nr:7789_t:CDS:10 [Acaulospora morrowiae]
MSTKARNLVHLLVLLVFSTLVFTFELDFDDLDLEFSDGNMLKPSNNKLMAIKASNNSLLWGTYRPNLYFGIRPRLPESLMTGLLWFGADDYKGFWQMRHACDQSDELDEYSYKKHDGRSFAMQTITDIKNNLVLKTEFLKAPGGENGGDWAVRITGEPIVDEVSSAISFLYYFGLEGEGSLDLLNDPDKSGLKGPVELSGETPELGKFRIRVVEDSLNRMPRIITSTDLNKYPNDLKKFQYWGHLVPDGEVWRAKDYLNGMFTTKLSNFQPQNDAYPPPPFLFALNNEVGENSNFFVIQKMVDTPFQFDIFFESDSSPAHIDDLSNLLKTSSRDFDARFERTFGLSEKGFEKDHIYFAQAMMSNLIGGIGYFYGSSIVDKSYVDDVDKDEQNLEDKREADPQLTPPASLFTATPSRPFFPRGFYWDEGFHQLLIGSWDNDLSLEIIKNWVSLIDDNGWVAREQILGEEARSKVPQEFQTQYPHYANPPMILMAICSFIERLNNVTSFTQFNVEVNQDQIALGQLSSTTDPEILPNRHLHDPELAKGYLAEIYPKLRANYKWFRRTQWGEIKEWGRKATSKEAYRWRGRTPGHTLTSGLDDYPRPSPHPAELHVDLMCWVGFMARSLMRVAEKLGKDDDIEDFTKQYKNILANLDDLHWSEEHKAYCDVSVDENEESVHVCHKGYLSLFPMLLGFLPNNSTKLGAILDMMHNPDELWSPYGLRSLSKLDEYYNTGENYWVGPVWININYLALSSLYTNYASKPGPYQSKAKTIYKELRNNIINNVYNEFKKSGYVWEQYSSINGEGKRSHPFTGWTSLVVLIMAEKY